MMSMQKGICKNIYFFIYKMTSEMRLKSVFLADVKVSLEEPKDPHLSMYMLNAGPRPSTYIWGGLGEGEGWIHIFL